MVEEGVGAGVYVGCGCDAWWVTGLRGSFLGDEDGDGEQSKHHCLDFHSLCW